MDKNLFSFTFHGTQGYNPFSIQVVASTVQEARVRALDSIAKEARVRLVERSDHKGSGVPLDNIPLPSSDAHPVEDHTGSYCADVEQFFHPIFTPPSGKMNELIPFNEWIITAPVKIKSFNPYAVKVYSCLDG